MSHYSLKGIKLTHKQKKLLALGIIVILLGIVFSFVFQKKEFKIEAGSPAAALNDFYSFIQKGDIEKAASLIDRSIIYHGRETRLSAEEENRQATDFLYTYINGVHINGYKIIDEHIVGDTAIVTIKTDGAGIVHNDKHKMVRKGRVWKVLL